MLNFLLNKWPFGLMLGLVSLGVTVHLSLVEKNISSSAGEFSTGRPTVVKSISVGATRFIVASPDGVLIRDADDGPFVSVAIKENRLFLSAWIRDSAGGLLAEIQDNQWRVKRDATFDRNFNDHALEVRDRQGRTVLQVVNFGETFHVAGVFRCKNGWTYVLGPVGRRFDKGAIMELRPPGVEPEYKISPICDYPSELHMGSCPGVESLRSVVRRSLEGSGYLLGGSLSLCKADARSSTTKRTAGKSP